MLRTKLYRPDISKGLIYREEIFKKLESAKHKKLTLVSAPAGFGKSTAIIQWLNRTGGTSAWYSIDASDNDPVTFLRYLISSVRVIIEGFGQKAFSLLGSSGLPSVETIANLLLNDLLELEETLFIIIDDFHLITEKVINDLLSFFIENLPGNAHLILITRSDPFLSLARLRSRQEICEIRVPDLSFDANGIYDFFRKRLKINVSIEDARTLELKTEGWIAGLQLAGISLQGENDVSGFVRRLKGNNRYIMDYLVEEVLEKNPVEIRNFLLVTSVLKRITASLCDAILDTVNSHVIIELVERNNMFLIPLDSERKWYRYHHLFADLLKLKLSTNGHVNVKDIHRRASQWFEENGLIEEAIEHAHSCNDYKRSVDLLGRIIQNMWLQGQHSAILNYAAPIPEEIIRENPEFCLYYSWILISTGNKVKAKPLLDTSYKSMQDRMSDPSLKGNSRKKHEILFGRIAAAHAYHETFSLPSQKILDYVETASNYLMQDDHVWLGWTFYAQGMGEYYRGNLDAGRAAFEKSLVHGKRSFNLHLISTITATIATHEQRKGNFRQSYTHCTNLLQFMKETGYGDISKTEWTFSQVYTMIALVQATWAEFDKAKECIEIADRLCQNENNIIYKLSVLLAYSYVLHAHDDLGGAVKKILEFEKVLNHNEVYPHLFNTYVGWRIFLFIRQDMLEEANIFAAEKKIGLEIEVSYNNEAAYPFFIRLLIAQERLKDAKFKLSEMLALAGHTNRKETLVQLHIFYALIEIRLNNKEKAKEHLIDAMEVATGENLIIYFLFDLNQTKELLLRALMEVSAKNTGISAEFAKNLKTAIERKDKAIKERKNSDLSSREMEVLLLLSDGLSNMEIAEKLFISIQTVKSHVKNILLKLEAGSRHHAAAAAKEKGLL